MRDGSLGPGLPGIVAPGLDDLGQHADYLIRGDLAEQRGGNLFHSFEKFSIGTGETAAFTEQGLPAARPVIDHVISRVTGGQVSEIDGTLRSTIDSADVWLMNPQGIVFGENAGGAQLTRGIKLPLNARLEERLYTVGHPERVPCRCSLRAAPLEPRAASPEARETPPEAPNGVE